MKLFSACLILYISILLLIRPYPSSLKSARPTILEHFKGIKATLILGVLLIIIFFITSNFKFISVDENLYYIFALNNIKDAIYLWPVQIVSHTFIHQNIIHLIGNVSLLGILSIYEKRVGSKRFLIIFVVSSLLSSISILFSHVPTATVGASGGIFGLAAAYFTDHDNLTIKEWLITVLGLIVLFIVLSIINEIQDEFSKEMKLTIDHFAHFLGTLSAIIYCRLVKLNKNVLIES
ncbi:MAG TPA: rhomboid family intramembrane serine protease [Spirochaetia bacterium]|nr:rhomboid family intramembrane serine protease [Spirochaetia bacterium]